MCVQYGRLASQPAVLDTPDGPLSLSYSQSLGTTETVNMFRYAPENNRGSNRKMATEKLKLDYTTQKTWTYPQSINHKKSHEIRLIRPQHNTKIQNTHLKFLTSLTPSVEKTVNFMGSYKFINQEI
jgi:hypothetical protein